MHIKVFMALQGDKILLGSCRYHGEFELLKVLLKADVATSARANKVIVAAEDRTDIALQALFYYAVQVWYNSKSCSKLQNELLMSKLWH